MIIPEYSMIPTLQDVILQLQNNVLNPRIAGQHYGIYHGGRITKTRRGLSNALKTISPNDFWVNNFEHPEVVQVNPAFEQTIMDYDPKITPLARFYYFYQASGDPGSPIFVKYKGTSNLLGNQLWTGVSRTTPPVVDFATMLDLHAYDCTFGAVLNIACNKSVNLFERCIFYCPVYAYRATFKDCVFKCNMQNGVTHPTIIGS